LSQIFKILPEEFLHLGKCFLGYQSYKTGFLRHSRRQIINGTVHIRHLCRKTTVFSCPRCL